jgi:hypothetical protein
MRRLIDSVKLDRTVGESHHNDLDVGLYYAYLHSTYAQKGHTVRLETGSCVRADRIINGLAAPKGNGKGPEFDAWITENFKKIQFEQSSLAMEDRWLSCIPPRIAPKPRPKALTILAKAPTGQREPTSEPVKGLPGNPGLQDEIRASGRTGRSFAEASVMSRSHPRVGETLLW